MNLASHNAGVTVAIVGISNHAGKNRRIFSIADNGNIVAKDVETISAYLVTGSIVEVQSRSKPLSDIAIMQFGNHPYYGASLIFPVDEARRICAEAPQAAHFIRPLYGSKEFISALPRACLWIEEQDVDEAVNIPDIASRIADVARARMLVRQDSSAQKLSEMPYRFREQITARRFALIVPRVSSVNRPFLPVGLLEANCIIQEKAFALYDAPLWHLAIIASRIHLIWIATVCARMRTDFSYSNTLGWNTFPVPTLTQKNKADLTRCAENILLAREAHFPATIADLYAPGIMPIDLQRAHDSNDEVLDRIYIGRRFRNDTERLEKLFEFYAKMIVGQEKSKKCKVEESA